MTTTTDAPLPEPAAWVTRDYVRDRWADAPLSDATLGTLIESAHAQVIAYAPALADGAPVPPHYQLAEAMQTRALGAVAESATDVEGFSPEGFAVRRRPLTADVKALLRPRRGVPVTG